MPNWTSNRATIIGPAPVIAEITEILNDPEGNLLAWMVPEPANNEDWYNWRVANWGTKWPISDVYFENATEQDMIEFSFCSAWTPPTEAFRTWADSDGRVEFRLEYWEPGVAFVGSATYDGEAYMDDSVDMNTDPAEYRRRASEVWGYEEYEEPEPLTEWYQHGVKQKGLPDGI